MPLQNRSKQEWEEIALAFNQWLNDFEILMVNHFGAGWRNQADKESPSDFWVHNAICAKEQTEYALEKLREKIRSI